MPTPEETNKIAEQYAEFTDGSPADKAYIRAIAQCYTEWLSKNFCIVSKEEIKADYDFNAVVAEQFAKGAGAKCAQMREWHQGKCDELISLFGKELFNVKEK